MATKSLTQRAEILAPLGLTPLLRQSELEALYGVSDWTVNQWVQRGCPVERTPFRGRRFDLARVREWIQADTSAA
ncbi:terminase small subunit [Streptomyces boncukensis]|uniref:Terminase small subunit n=1 Tax=Streptomyces boncukensis TaxID=2711219 RepID=A0A6G4WYD2_9ACTN|nr:terminase small subunit [Streptomyces boncukensis]NGO70245.1 terminase small subunit [Streptomyces boncukensis]